MSDRLEDVIRGCVRQFASTSDFKTFAQSGNGLSLSEQDVTTIIENHRFSAEEQRKKLFWLWVERNKANATAQEIRNLVTQYYGVEQYTAAPSVGRLEDISQDVAATDSYLPQIENVLSQRSGSDILLTWDEVSDSNILYNVEIFSDDVKLEETHTAEVSQYRMKSPILGKEYRFQVWAKDAWGNSGIKTQSKNVIKVENIEVAGGSMRLNECKVTFPIGTFNKQTKVWMSVGIDNSLCPEEYIGITPVLDISADSKFLQDAIVQIKSWCVGLEKDKIDILRFSSKTDWGIIKPLRITKDNSIEFRCREFSLYTVAIKWLQWLLGKQEVIVDNCLYISNKNKFHFTFFEKSETAETSIRSHYRELGAQLSPIWFNPFTLKTGDRLRLELQIEGGQEDLQFNMPHGQFICDNIFRAAQRHELRLQLLPDLPEYPERLIICRILINGILQEMQNFNFPLASPDMSGLQTLNFYGDVHVRGDMNINEQGNIHQQQLQDQNEQGEAGAVGGNKARNLSDDEFSIKDGNSEIIYNGNIPLGFRVYEGRIVTHDILGKTFIQDKLAVKLRTIDTSLSPKEIDKQYWNEIKNSINLPPHNNVGNYVRHHTCYLPNEPTVVIVTDLCNHKKLETHLPGFSVEDKKILLLQLCYGLKHIHETKPKPIAHRDLKPSNVLLSLDGNHIKIIDFGISKEFALDGKKTITRSTGFSGSYGWVASEMCSDNRSKEFDAWVKADIYSLGLLIYFIFTDGKHPYQGSPASRHAKIENKEQPDFSVIENEKEFHDRYLLIDLLKAMLSHEPDARPGITKILQHCFTWNAVKKMSFIHVCHRYFEQPCDEDRKNSDDSQDPVQFDRSEKAPKDNDEPVRTKEEEKALQRIHGIIGGDWVESIKEKLEDPNSGNNERPYENSFTDLVRYIRNTHEYYYKKPEEVKSKLGSKNEGMWKLFTSNFPEFFIHLFHLIKKEFKGDDEKKYLQKKAKNCELPQK
ncbi:uncharacterized protein LOC144427274 [Styela clava]